MFGVRGDCLAASRGHILFYNLPFAYLLMVLPGTVVSSCANSGEHVTGVALVKTSCSPSILLKYMLFCFFPDTYTLLCIET
jgi:hypothetical protein